MKILHTSDWHLGRQFHNVSLLEDQRHVLQQIVDYAVSSGVDVVIIAGDIYDRSVPPANAVSVMSELISQLHQAGIIVIITSGNHDGAERLGFAAGVMASQGVHILSDLSKFCEPIVVNDEVAFYGIPFADPVSVRHAFGVEVNTHDEAMAYLTQRITDIADPSLATVVIAHCFIDGGEPSDSERPLSLGGADCVSYQHFMPFSYTALGHLHGRQYKGSEHIRYSGSPLKYSFSETKQIKSFTVVELTPSSFSFEQIPLIPKRDMRRLEGELQQVLESSVNDSARDDYLYVALTDTPAIMDVMSKLRDVYPNVLHVERPGLMKSNDTRALNKQRKQQSEERMFSDFFSQVMGQPMTIEQQTCLHKTLQSLLE
ncbi:exonuclease SbcCD subunit D [Neptunomonas phycophila]|uniref:exonuclease SbcCD subunit D n=1 Tax=Neptunomonas phycophila TaxID=1572645 RepID=UPI003515969A